MTLNAIRCLSLLSFVLIFLFPWMLSKILPNKATEAPTRLNEKITIDRALSLYTFYEGRVQSTKSILIGVLAAILSLQIPLVIHPLWKNLCTCTFEDALPVIILCIPALCVYYSMKIHMDANAEKSKIFQKSLCCEGILYNPPLSKWKYEFRERLPLALDLGLLIAICFLSAGSLFWWAARS